MIRHFVVWGIGVLIGLIPLWVFNTLVYQHPLGASIGFRLSHFVELLSFDPQVIRWQENVFSHAPLWKRIIMVASTQWIGGAPNRFVSVLLGLSFGLLAIILRLRVLYTRSFVLLGTTALLVTAYATLLQTSEFLLAGFLTTTPLIVLFFTYRSPDEGGQRKRMMSSLVLTFLVFAGVGGGVALGTGGPQWGPRYLLPAYIPMILVIAFNIERHRDSLPSPGYTPYHVSVAALMVVSLVIQARGLEIQYRQRQSRQFAHEQIPQLPVDVIVSDGHQFLVEMAAYHYEYDKYFFFVENERRYEELLGILSANGIRRFAYFPVKRGRVSPIIRTTEYEVVPIGSLLYQIRRIPD